MGERRQLSFACLKCHKEQKNKKKEEGQKEEDNSTSSNEEEEYVVQAENFLDKVSDTEKIKMLMAMAEGSDTADVQLKFQELIKTKHLKISHITPLAKHLKTEVLHRATLLKVGAKPKHWLGTKLQEWLKK